MDGYSREKMFTTNFIFWNFSLVYNQICALLGVVPLQSDVSVKKLCLFKCRLVGNVATLTSFSGHWTVTNAESDMKKVLCKTDEDFMTQWLGPSTLFYSFEYKIETLM